MRQKFISNMMFGQFQEELNKYLDEGWLVVEGELRLDRPEDRAGMPGFALGMSSALIQHSSDHPPRPKIEILPPPVSRGMASPGDPLPTGSGPSEPKNAAPPGKKK